MLVFSARNADVVLDLTRRGTSLASVAGQVLPRGLPTTRYKIVCTQLDYQAFTSEDGRFSLGEFPNGTYEIRVESAQLSLDLVVEVARVTERPSAPRAVAEQLLEAGELHGALVTMRQSDTADGDDLYFAARLALMNGEQAEALEWIARARAAFTQDGNLLFALRTDLGLINVLGDLARYGDAVDVAQSLLISLAKIDPADIPPSDQDLYQWLGAGAQENLGTTLRLVGRHREAVDAFAEAHRAYERVGSLADNARARANLGVVRLETGDPQAALEDLESARSQFTDDSDTWLIHRCMMLESQALAKLGRYGASLSRLEAADGHARQHLVDATPDALRARLVRTDVQLALNAFSQVLAGCDVLAASLEERGMLRELALASCQKAQALLGLGEPESACDSANAAVELFQALALPVQAARAGVILGRCLTPDAARVEIDNAIRVLTQARETREVAEAALAGADMMTSDDARRHFIDIAESAGASDSPETAWRYLAHKASLERNDVERAALLDESLRTLAVIREDLDTDSQRAPFMINRRFPLEARLSMLLDAGDYNRSLSAIGNLQSPVIA